MANTWQYADWITYDVGPSRLERLRLHIAEVSQRTLGTTTRSNAVTAVDPAYLKGLRDEESRLEARVNVRNFARTRARFGRD